MANLLKYKQLRSCTEEVYNFYAYCPGGSTILNPDLKAGSGPTDILNGFKPISTGYQELC